MKKSRFSEEQIAYALKQAEAGNKVQEICRQMGISQATFFNWKNKFGGMGVTELRRLRQMEEENAQLKKLVADLSLDRQMLQDIGREPVKRDHLVVEKMIKIKQGGYTHENQALQYRTDHQHLEGSRCRHACQGSLP